MQAFALLHNVKHAVAKNRLCRRYDDDAKVGRWSSGVIQLQSSATQQVEEGARIVESFILCLTIIL